jgi:drug/metabolite transporter (DMT)-like permease
VEAVTASEPGPSRSPREVYLLLLLTCAFWGGTPVAGKFVIRDLPPLTAGVLRYGLATLLLLAACWRQIPHPAALRLEQVWTLSALGFLGTALNHALYFYALTFAPAAHGAIIAPTASPVVTLVLAGRLGGERITRRQLAGVGLCLVGVTLVVRLERLAAGAGPDVLLGDLLFVLNGAGWGVYSYLSKHAMQSLSAGATLTLGMVVGTLLLVPGALAEQPWPALRDIHPIAWVALAYLAVAGTVLAFLWWNVGIRRVGAGRTAVFTNLVPVFGVLLSWAILGEQLDGTQLAGAALAVTGVLVCQQRPAGRRGDPGAPPTAPTGPRSDDTGLPGDRTEPGGTSGARSSERAGRPPGPGRPRP